MSRRRHTSRTVTPLHAAVVVMALVVGVLGLLVARQHPTLARGTDDSQVAIVGDTRPSLVVVGDSYSGGSAMGGYDEAGWPAILAVSEGWSLQNLSEGGTGYVAVGTGAPFAARLSQLIAIDPAIVIVEGGHNDAQYATADVDAAAEKFLTGVKAGLPKARFVVIGPIWPTDQPPANVLAINAFLKHTAAKLGAQFVDPIAEHWFAGSYAALIGSDGTHPTDAGHRHIAAVMKADLH